MQYLNSNRWEKRIKALEKIGKNSDLFFTFPGLGREYFSFDSSCKIDVQVLNSGIYFLIKFDMQTIKNFVISTIIPKERFRLNSPFVKKFFKFVEEENIQRIIHQDEKFLKTTVLFFFKESGLEMELLDGE